MPATVFPAPGCENGQQFILPFQGFDISHDTGGEFSNILAQSVDLTTAPWIKGTDGIAVTALSQFNIVADYINDADTLPYQPIYVYKNEFGEHTIVSTSATQYFGQQLNLLAGTDYTFSFYAKRGTATELTYGVYDVTNSADIVSATSYYNNINTTAWTRISTTFNTGTATTVNVFMLWNIASGSPGTINVFGPQLDQGTVLKPYDPTGVISWAAQGITSVTKQSYGSSHLGTFNDPSKDFDPIPIRGQTSATWNVVSDYIYDNARLTYSSLGTNNTLTVPEQTSRPYQVGDTVTIANSNTGYRSNFQVTGFTTTTLTINTVNAVPVSGSYIVNPSPQVYPQNLVSTPDLLANMFRRTNTTARENLFAVTYLPSSRSVDYFLDRDFLTTTPLASSQFKLANFKVKGTIETPRASKVLPRTDIRSVLDRRSVSKILPRANLATVTENRRVARTESLTSTSATWYSRFPSGIPALGGISYPPSGTPGFELGDIPKFDYNYRLEQFDNLLNGTVFAVTGQDNVSYNSVQQHIYDLDILSVTTSSTGAEQTIYYNPTEFRVIIPAGFYVKISSNTTSWTVFVKSATYNSITFDAVVGFPTSYVGNLTIQSLTSFVYPKTAVDNTLASYVSANGLDLRNYSVTPRDLLSAAEVKPNFRTYTSLFIDREIQGITPQTTNGRMETFADANLIGEFQTVITGENTETHYSTASWYLNESDVLTYTTTPITVKVLYFADTGAAPFVTGSTVRIRNSQTNYLTNFTVIEGVSTYIKIALSPSTPAPAIGSIIERTVNTVYAQSFVTTTTAPTNSRENLYYTTLAGGLRGTEYTVWGSSLFSLSNNLQANKLSTANEKIKGVTSTIVPSTLEKPVTSLRTDPNRIVVGKTFVASKIKNTVDVVSTGNVFNYYAQSAVVVTQTPTTPRENLYYFNIAPGYRANKTITDGVIPGTVYTNLSINNLNKPVTSLISDKTILSANKLSAAAESLGTVSNIYTQSFVDRLKITQDRTSLFYTPFFSNLTDGFVVRADRANIDYAGVTFRFKVRSDLSIVRYGDLQKDSFKVEGEIGRISDINYLEPFKVRYDTTEIFETPSFSNLEKQLSRLVASDISSVFQTLEKPITIIRADNSLLSTNKLSTSSVIKGDSLTFGYANLQKQILTITDNFPTFTKVEQLDKFTVPTNSVEIFYAPPLDRLADGFVVKDLPILIKADKLSSAAIVKSDSTETLRPTTMERVKIPESKSQIFETSFIGKLNASIVVRSDTNIRVIGEKLSSSVKVVSDRNSYQGPSVIDLWESKATYSTVYAPNNAKSRFQYFNIAPGFRYNSSIQQGLLFGDDNTTIKSATLGKFDNVGFTTSPYIPIITTTDPILDVAGRSAETTNDVPLWYINDEDILTLVPVGTPVITLYFLARDWLPIPFPTGSTVRVKQSNVTYYRELQVLTGTAGSITILDPGDLPSISGMTLDRIGAGYDVTVYFNTQVYPPYPLGTYVTLINSATNEMLTVQVTEAGRNYITYNKQSIGFNLPTLPTATIASASITVFESRNVVTTVAPTTPREMLYYSTLAGGYKYGQLNTVWGNSLSDESPYNLRSSNIERDQWKIRGTRESLDNGNLEKQLMILKSLLFKSPDLTFLEPLKLKDYKNQVFYVDKNGLILKLKTGPSKQGQTGIFDPAAPKKEPIQFWN